MNEILILGFILLVTKLVSELFLRLKMPTVIGVILSGIVCGPLLNIIQVDNNILFLSELGILFLMFTAGLETDLANMKKQGKASLLAAFAGVFAPLAMSFLFMFFGMSIKTSYVIGLTLTATSVSITVMTLLEIGKLNTRSGTTILGAAVIDDVIAIILLTVSFVFLFHSGNIFMVIGKFGLLAVVIIAIYKYIINGVLRISSKFKAPDTILAVSVIFMLFLSYFSESMGVAGITGAYVAGVSITQTHFRRRITEGVNTIVNTLFISMFFFVVGLKTSLNMGDLNILITAILIVISILGKVLGSGTACLLSGMTFDESFKVGVGMIPRGEVGLVIASMAFNNNFIDQTIYNSFVIMILLTTMITPIWLNILYKKNK
jgi:Kef-type K+ transport system membrane component KefB